jgi:hypothetical protein
MAGERSGKKRAAAVEEDAAPQVEEEAFPRGGGDKFLTPLQKRQLTQQAKDDFEAEQKSDKKPKKAKVSGGKVRRAAAFSLRRLLRCAPPLSAAQPPSAADASHPSTSAHGACCGW